MNEEKNTTYDGLALVAAFWLWRSLAWLAPGYIGFSSVGRG